MSGILEITVRLLVALLLGGVIGIEREFRAKDAGFRTHFLVCVGSALFCVVSQYGFGDAVKDASRVAAQVVSGIGFLGGGLILKEGFTVRGLNTAATIWCSAACGTLAGVGMYLEAFVLVACVLITHCVFRPLGTFILKLNTKMYHYTVRAECCLLYTSDAADE